MIVFIPRKRDVWIILTAAQHRRQALGELVLEKPELVGTRLPSRFGFFIFDIMPRMVASFISLVSLCFVCLCCSTVPVSAYNTTFHFRLLLFKISKVKRRMQRVFETPCAT